MRKCKYFIWDGIQRPRRKVEREGLWHQWGMEMEEFESGGVDFSVGIVENPDGSISTPLACDVIFLDQPYPDKVGDGS